MAVCPVRRAVDTDMSEFGEMPPHVPLVLCRPVGLHRLDGDTFRAIVFIDARVTDAPIVLGDEDEPMRIRLKDASAPETRGATRAEGLAAAAYTYAWLARQAEGGGEWPLRVRTFGVDAFGRILGWVYGLTDGTCLNREIIADGFAIEDVR